MTARCAACSNPVPPQTGLCPACREAFRHITNPDTESETTMPVLPALPTARKTSARKTSKKAQQSNANEMDFGDQPEPGTAEERESAEQGASVEEQMAESDAEQAERDAATAATEPAPAAKASRGKRAPRERKPLSAHPEGEQRRIALWMLRSTLRLIDGFNWAAWGVDGVAETRPVFVAAQEAVRTASKRPGAAARVSKKVQPGSTCSIVEASRADYSDVLDEADLDGITVTAISKGSARVVLASGQKAVLPTKILVVAAVQA